MSDESDEDEDNDEIPEHHEDHEAADDEKHFLGRKITIRMRDEAKVEGK